MRGWRRGGGGVTARFGAPEAALLRVLVADVLALLEAGAPPPPAADEDPLVALTGIRPDAAGTGGDPRPPADPALARLLPDAYRLDDDPEQAGAAADYRRFTEPELRAGKAAGLRTVLATLPEGGGAVVLDDAAAQAWLTALTDVRLVLGSRLGVTAELAEGRLDPDDPRAPGLEVFDFVGWLQESLVHAVAGW